MKREAGKTRWVAGMVLVLAAACGGGPTDPGSDPSPDPGGGGGDGGGGDPPPAHPGPFPSDPRGGEFAWVVSAPGAVDPVSVAVDGEGSIFVVATQTGAVKLGSVSLPAPSGGKALLALKLTPEGKAIWGRSVATALDIRAQALAITPAGDAVIGGKLRTGASAGTEDAFVRVLDGDDGETIWHAPLASSSSDHVAGVAVGADGAGATAIYVYGKLGSSGTIGDHPFPAGAYLLRYAGDGTLRWTESFPRLDPGLGGSLALDPQRGPVITGVFHGELLLGDQLVLTAEHVGESEDAVVAGFTADGQLRFARQLFATSHTSPWHNVAVAPGGDIYVASDTSGSEIVVDDHVIPTPDSIHHLFLLRLTPEGRYASSAVIAGRQSEASHQVATDDAGAAYLLGSCSGQVDVQPEITCTGQGGRIIVSYDAANEYRWATYVTPAWVDAIAPVPGKEAPSGEVFPSNRLVVAGRALSGKTDFGGVKLPTHQLFIAALASGPARPPVKLPAAPTISSVQLDGTGDREIRHGGTAVLVIRGAGLDEVTRARLGDLDVHVPAGAGTDVELRLPVWIPPGHAPGWLGLVLGNAGGSAQVADAVRVTPVVVSPTASGIGRGTFASPMPLCGPDWLQLLRYGDELRLRDGVHVCDDLVLVRRGVNIRGESRTGTIVRGVDSMGGGFRGFGVTPGRFGATAIEDLTIDDVDPSAHAITAGTGRRISVRDVDVRGVAAGGIRINGGVATLTRYRYLQSTGRALEINGGSVDASQVEVGGASDGVWIHRGTLRVRGSRVAAARTAVSLSGELAAADLGTAASPGGNVLESGPGFPALEDGRTEAGVAVDARGTTLNRMSFSGDVLGPADKSGAYRIAGPNTIRF